MCLSPCNGCLQLLDPKLVEQATEDLCLLWNWGSVCLENICLKQNKEGLISPNFFPSARIIIAPSSNLVLSPLKIFSVGFRSLRAQTSYLQTGYSYLLRSLGYLRKQSRFDTEYREYINMLPSV